jgi:TonB family protein
MQTSGHTGTKMTRAWRQWEGQVVNSSFPLRQYLGGSERCAVFLTERRGREPQKAAIKLIPADPANIEIQLSRWELAATLSHPHLLRLFEKGRCQLDNVSLLYVVMEYAEENLAQILPQRPLTPAEAREMLEPALDALAYVHGKSFVHRRLKPSNIMAVRDQLKLSSDSLLRIGDPTGSGMKSTAYDAPEIASGKISPESDAWSLGMTLMEALTQRLPAREGMAEPVPETVPAPFMGIAHCCLRRDPQRRCTVADIAERLRSTSAVSQQPSTMGIPAESAKWRYIFFVVVVAVIGAALLVGPRLGNPRPESQPESSVQNTSPKPEPTPGTTDTKSAAQKPGNQTSRHAVTPAPASGTTEAPTAGSGNAIVLQQIMPSVSQSARNTIHGTIKVRVRVAVDPSGNVEGATFVSSGPSKYFARQAMQAAQRWKFVPAQVNGQEAPRTWILRFGFRRSGTDAALEPAQP